MKLSEKFVCAARGYGRYSERVPSPLMRKVFYADAPVRDARIAVCGLGFYRIWINGTEITKGMLAPYITNPDEMLAYDVYDLLPYLNEGRNALAFMLGNGMLNAPGGSVWDFQLDLWRSSPKLAFTLKVGDELTEADETVLCAESPIVFDDLRSGEHYDARREIPGWQSADFDDSGWSPAIAAETPRGKRVVCTADAVRPTGEQIKPVKIRRARLAPYSSWHPVSAGEALRGDGVMPELFEEGWLYDFGVNKTGFCRLKIKGERGQRIQLQYGEMLGNPDAPECMPLCSGDEGVATVSNLGFYPDGYCQRDVYVLKGGEEEIYIPSFTYHGFRWCLVDGLRDGQVTEDFLTYIVCNSDVRQTGFFKCSDKTADSIFEICRVSDLSNFWYYPTDCPHREKNGWTGDIACSAEHMSMMYDCRRSFAQWLGQVRESQAKDGSIPCMVPTGKWGRPAGPSWDAALTYVPYSVYKYTGDRKILSDNAGAIFRYIDHMAHCRRKDGLVKEYLGDWLPIGGVVKPSAEYTDTVSFYGILRRAEFIFGVLGQEDRLSYTSRLAEEVRAAIRAAKISDCLADTGCQTSQALALYWGLFDPEETEEAGRKLVEMIHENGDFLDVGLLGVRVIFHVLFDLGESDLAYKMAARPEYPSYAHFLEQGMTSLPEDFAMDADRVNSLNHHFLGDVTNVMMSRIAGLRYNTDGRSFKKLTVQPGFVAALDNAEASILTPLGRATVGWRVLAEDEKPAAGELCAELDGRRYAVYADAPALDVEFVLPDKRAPLTASS